MEGLIPPPEKPTRPPWVQVPPLQFKILPWFTQAAKSALAAGRGVYSHELRIELQNPGTVKRVMPG
jgi:hypothetical protein